MLASAFAHCGDPAAASGACREPRGPRHGAARPSVPSRRLVAQASAAPVSTGSSSNSSVTDMYNQLAGVLAAPGGAVAAGPTPLGRGLVATQQVTQGATLLSGEQQQR